MKGHRPLEDPELGIIYVKYKDGADTSPKQETNKQTKTALTQPIVKQQNVEPVQKRIISIKENDT